MFQFMRQATGLFRDDLSRQFQVDSRAVRRWESTVEPPDSVSRWMEDRWEAFLTIADRIVDIARERETNARPSLTLVCYSAPSTLAATRGRAQHFGTHQALTHYVGLALAREGLTFTITFNPSTIDEGVVDVADFVD